MVRLERTFSKNKKQYLISTSVEKHVMEGGIQESDVVDRLEWRRKIHTANTDQEKGPRERRRRREQSE